jgi:hypothetical protein
MSQLWLVLLLVPSLLGGVVEAMLKCNIEGTTGSSPSTKVATTVFGSVDFEFWYAVGLTESTILDDIRIFELEQLLYTTIDEDVLWCSSGEEGVDQDQLVQSMEGEDTEGGGGTSRTRRRSLQADEASSMVEEVGGVIGPVLFTPGRKDEVTDSTCPRYITITFQLR